MIGRVFSAALLGAKVGGGAGLLAGVGVGLIREVHRAGKTAGAKKAREAIQN
jgi:hypothetical protein